MTSPPLLLASLLPTAWFTDLATWLLIGIGVVALVVLLKGADVLVDGAASLAGRLGLPKVIIGATILSLGTTSPEAAVSVLAAIQGEAGLALGNGVGSIIADTGLIFGAGLMLTRLPADRFLLNRQGWAQFASVMLLAGLCYGVYAVQGEAAVIGRLIGWLFLGLLAVYLYLSVRWSRGAKAAPGLTEEMDRLDPAQPVWKSGLLVLVGLVVVILSGEVFVQCATLTAVRVGIPESVLASTLVALGTSLPELVTGVTAIRRGHAELLVGNVIGADVLNVLFVIGLSAAAAPLPLIDPSASLPMIFLLVPIPTMVIMLILMRIYIGIAGREGHFDRWMGVPLLGLYGAYLAVSFLLA